MTKEELMLVEESLNELINTQVKYFNKMARKHCMEPAGNALDKIGRGEEAINIVRRELGWKQFGKQKCPGFNPRTDFPQICFQCNQPKHD